MNTMEQWMIEETIINELGMMGLQPSEVDFVSLLGNMITLSDDEGEYEAEIDYDDLPDREDAEEMRIRSTVGKMVEDRAAGKL